MREGTGLFQNLPGYVERLPEQSSLYRDLADRYDFTIEARASTRPAIPQRVGR